MLAVSANITDQQKMLAELFDNKFRSLGGAAMAANTNQNLTLMELTHLEFVVNMAAHDAGIAIWQEKAKWNAVRPFTAIAKVYPDTCAAAAQIQMHLMPCCPLLPLLALHPGRQSRENRSANRRLGANRQPV